MIRAIDNKVIVVELKRNQTAGGIFIPSTAVEPQAYGKIMSIGNSVPRYEDETLNIKEGDVIVYHKMGGQAISMKNKIYCCVPYPEIYGVLTDEEALQELEEIEIKPLADKLAATAAPSLITKI